MVLAVSLVWYLAEQHGHHIHEPNRCYKCEPEAPRLPRDRLRALAHQHDARIIIGAQRNRKKNSASLDTQAAHFRNRFIQEKWNQGILTSRVPASSKTCMAKSSGYEPAKYTATTSEFTSIFAHTAHG